MKDEILSICNNFLIETLMFLRSQSDNNEEFGVLHYQFLESNQWSIQYRISHDFDFDQFCKQLLRFCA